MPGGGGAVAGKSSKMISPAVPASARGRPGRRQAVVGRRRRRRRVIGADPCKKPWFQAEAGAGARACAPPSNRDAKDEYATRDAPGSCRYPHAATIAETGRHLGLQGGTSSSSDAVDHRLEHFGLQGGTSSSSDARNHRLEHCARGAEGDAAHGRPAPRYGRAAAQVRTAALVRRDAVERHACYRAGIFRPVEDLRVVAADGSGHAHRRRRR